MVPVLVLNQGRSRCIEFRVEGFGIRLNQSDIRCSVLVVIGLDRGEQLITSVEVDLADCRSLLGYSV